MNKIIQGDALQQLKELPEKSINMCMTSPPYWALRDYGTDVETIWDGEEDCEHDWNSETKVWHGDRGKGKHKEVFTDLKEQKSEHHFCSKCQAWKGQLGLEPTFDLYIKHLCDIFDEVKRVLRDDGTCWVNIGDTYSATRWTNDTDSGQPMNKFKDGHRGINPIKDTGDIPDKCLVMIPFRFAIEMVNRGWILRNTIIWHKRNCMPSSVKDRFTVDFEYLFFFSKKKKYYFETQREPHQSNPPKVDKNKLGKDVKWKKPLMKNQQSQVRESHDMHYDGSGYSEKGRNKRTVWTINPKPFKESHFAVYPEELCEIPIKAGCPEFVCKKCGNPKEWHPEKYGDKDEKEKRLGRLQPTSQVENTSQFKGYKQTCSCNADFTGGIVLDPFFGSGTTGLVALKQNKKFMGIELNKEYIEIANKRLKPYLEQTKL